jgi:hypothetical protein
MKQAKPNHIISVDSETGIYWNGKQVLRRKALIKAALEQETTRKYEDRGRSPLHFAAIENNPNRRKTDSTCQ